MAKRTIIHPGFPKSGTTALQGSLANCIPDLASQGIVFTPQTNNSHHRSAWAVTGFVFGWAGNGGTTYPISIWDKFSKQIRSEKGTSLITSEFFTGAKLDAIKKIKADLGESEYVVVFTIRPFARVLPSRYQQSLKKGLTLTYSEWLERLFDPAAKDVQVIDYAGKVGQWASVFGKENVRLVITDESNPDMLYRRFETATSIKQNTLKPAKNERLNRSLTISEVEILRQVNLMKPDSWKWPKYKEFVRANFVQHLSDSPSKFPGDKKLELPSWADEALAPYAHQQIQSFKDLGIEILGDLDSLYTPSATKVEVPDMSLVPVEIAADIILHLSSFQTLDRASTRKLISEIGVRLANSDKAVVKPLGKIIKKLV